MYQYKYYNPHDLYDTNLLHPIEDPYDTEQDPETLRRITAEYANVTALLTSIEMRLRARRDEVRKVFASRGRRCPPTETFAPNNACSGLEDHQWRWCIRL